MKYFNSIKINILLIFNDKIILFFFSNIYFFNNFYYLEFFIRIRYINLNEFLLFNNIIIFLLSIILLILRPNILTIILRWDGLGLIS